jgi:hypothetical protein
MRTGLCIGQMMIFCQSSCGDQGGWLPATKLEMPTLDPKLSIFSEIFDSDPRKAEIQFAKKVKEIDEADWEELTRVRSKDKPVDQGPGHEQAQESVGQDEQHCPEHEPENSAVLGIFGDRGHGKDQEGQDGAKGVVDDALPLEQGGGPKGDAGIAQHRQDDGGAGDDQDGAECSRGGKVEVAQVEGQEGHRAESHEESREDQRPEGSSDLARFGQVQAQAALEEDEGHRQGDDGAEQIAKEPIRIQDGLAEEELGKGPQKETGQQQEQERRDLEPTGDPLRPHAHDDETTEQEKEILIQIRAPNAKTKPRILARRPNESTAAATYLTTL